MPAREDGLSGWLPIVLPDGSIRYQCAGHPVTNDAGDVVEFIGASMDMTEQWLATTERGLAEEALRKSDERWRAVFENSAIGVALTDLSGRFLATNSAFQKMLGYTEEEIGTHLSGADPRGLPRIQLAARHRAARR